mgnify:CR=1 FL=1
MSTIIVQEIIEIIFAIIITILLSNKIPPVDNKKLSGFLAGQFEICKQH